MYIVVGEKTYTRLQNVSFAPETDISGSTLPINQMGVDIISSEAIVAPGQMVKMYDDRGVLWCNYWVTFAERMDVKTFRVEAASRLLKLERKTVSAKMYNAEPASNIISELFGGDAYTLDSSFESATINGFCPEQTARERLLWVCLVIGAYVKDFFTEGIQILPISNTPKLIPAQKTFWRPSMTYGEYVTAVKAVAYIYTEGTPQTTDKWVQADGKTYIQTQQEFVISNPSVPETAGENVVSVEGVTIIGRGNADEVLTRLSVYYFNRAEVDTDVINNADYEPGEKATTYTSLDTLVDGYIQSATFSFGLQSRSRLKIMVLDAEPGSEGHKAPRLIIKYMYGAKQLSKRTYFFPVGYRYDIENPHLEKNVNKRHTVYRPLNEGVSGTMPEEDTTLTEDYEIALEGHKKVLSIYCVDEMEVVESSGERILVIK